ncbi:MAG: class SAM-dependent methyltransferase [Chthoniobacteraceae bacterium]|nr:class SAM-dependent methyltransferase [Chthoniobacteraceae bacterium]
MNLDWPPTDELFPGEEYVKYAEVYDLLFEDFGVDIAFYVQAAARLAAAGSTILELGAGTGRLTLPLLEAGYHLVGVEPSGSMLERARQRLARYEERARLVHIDAQSMQFSERFKLAIAPYGMVAHLHSDAERLAVFRNVHAHLAPGGIFLFDDMPGWLAGPSDGSTLDLYRTAHDSVSGMTVRLMTNVIDVADQSLSVRYDLIDWLNADQRVARRLVVRIRFRNISLEQELALLRQAGFARVDLLGGFDGRSFCHDDLTRNSRLILQCHRGA